MCPCVSAHAVVCVCVCLCLCVCVCVCVCVVWCVCVCFAGCCCCFPAHVFVAHADGSRRHPHLESICFAKHAPLSSSNAVSSSSSSHTRTPHTHVHTLRRALCPDAATQSPGCRDTLVFVDCCQKGVSTSHSSLLCPFFLCLFTVSCRD